MFTYTKTPEENLQECQKRMKNTLDKDELRLIDKLYSNYSKTLPYHMKMMEINKKKDEETNNHSEIQFSLASSS